METKKCFKCGEILPLSEFYLHKGMKDGRINKCKLCAKKDVKDNYNEKSKDIEFVIRERERGREKYKRLNYVSKIGYKKEYAKKIGDVSYFFKKRKIDLYEKEIHHWNYIFKYDVFVLSRKAHKLIHKYIKYDSSINCFINSNNEVLDSKEKHYKYILKVFEENNVFYEIDSYNFTKKKLSKKNNHGKVY